MPELTDEQRARIRALQNAQSAQDVQAAQRSNLSDLGSDLWENTKGLGSIGAHLATGLAATPLAGIEGIGENLRTGGDMDRAADATRRFQEENTYPVNARGREQLASVVGALRGVGNLYSMRHPQEAGAVKKGAELAGQGWEKFSNYAPGTAAVTAGVIGTLDPFKGEGRGVARLADEVPWGEMGGGVDTLVSKEALDAAAAKGITPEPIVSPETEAAVAAPKAPKQKAVGNLWDNVTDPQEARAMALRGEHLKTSHAGDIVGAPEGVKTLEDVERLRAKADAQVEAGESGMDWYDRARRETEGLAPDDPAMQSLFARGTAAYSPQSTPPTEIGSFAKQHNARVLTGEDTRVRTQAQANAVARAYGDEGAINPENIKLGKKTGPYAEAKDPTVDEGSLYKTANDIWHGRVMGYGEDFDRGFTPQEHGYLTGENLLLAERAKARDVAAGVDRGVEWTPRSAQAATWTAQRKQQYLAEALKRGAPDTPQLRASIEERAKAGIPEAVDQNLAFIMKEERPGSLTGEDPRAGDYSTSREMIPERDPVIDALKMYQRDTVPTEGFYVNQQGAVERNPAGASPVLVGKNAGKVPSTPEAEMAALEQAAHQHAFTRAQDSVGITRFHPESAQRVGDLSGVVVRRADQSPEQLAALEQAAQDVGASPIDMGEQTLLTQFGDQGPVKGTTKAMIDALRARGVEGEVKRGTVEANLVESKMPAAQGTGQATEHLLAESARREGLIPGLEKKTAQAVADDAAAVQAMRKAAAASSGGKLREDLTRALGVLSKGGLPALRAFVKEHGSKGLPAVVLAMLAGHNAQEEPQL